MTTPLKVGDRVKWRTSHFSLGSMKRSAEYWQTGVVAKIDKRRNACLSVLPDTWADDPYFHKQRPTYLRREPGECEKL